MVPRVRRSETSLQIDHLQWTFLLWQKPNLYGQDQDSIENDDFGSVGQRVHNWKLDPSADVSQHCCGSPPARFTFLRSGGKTTNSPWKFSTKSEESASVRQKLVLQFFQRQLSSVHQDRTKYE